MTPEQMNDLKQEIRKTKKWPQKKRLAFGAAIVAAIGVGGLALLPEGYPEAGYQGTKIVRLISDDETRDFKFATGGAFSDIYSRIMAATHYQTPVTFEGLDVSTGNPYTITGSDMTEIFEELLKDGDIVDLRDVRTPETIGNLVASDGTIDYPNFENFDAFNYQRVVNRRIDNNQVPGFGQIVKRGVCRVTDQRINAHEINRNNVYSHNISAAVGLTGHTDSGAYIESFEIGGIRYWAVVVQGDALSANGRNIDLAFQEGNDNNNNYSMLTLTAPTEGVYLIGRMTGREGPNTQGIIVQAAEAVVPVATGEVKSNVKAQVNPTDIKSEQTFNWSKYYVNGEYQIFWDRNERIINFGEKFDSFTTYEFLGWLPVDIKDLEVLEVLNEAKVKINALLADVNESSNTGVLNFAEKLNQYLKELSGYNNKIVINKIALFSDGQTNDENGDIDVPGVIRRLQGINQLGNRNNFPLGIKSGDAGPGENILSNQEFDLGEGLTVTGIPQSGNIPSQFTINGNGKVAIAFQRNDAANHDFVIRLVTVDGTFTQDQLGEILTARGNQKVFIFHTDDLRGLQAVYDDLAGNQLTTDNGVITFEGFSTATNVNPDA